MVIGGFTDPEGSRQGFGALLLGVYEPDGRLAYSGKVGTGFSDAIARGIEPVAGRARAKDEPLPQSAEGRGSAPRPLGAADAGRRGVVRRMDR